LGTLNDSFKLFVCVRSGKSFEMFIRAVIADPTVDVRPIRLGSLSSLATPFEDEANL